MRNLSQRHEAHIAHIGAASTFSLVFIVNCKLLMLDEIYKYIYMFSVFRLVNKTSTDTEASLPPGIEQLYSINSWIGVHEVLNIVQLGLSHNK